MEWVRDPMLDTETLETPIGTYFCMRTWCDVAVLYLDSKELRRSGSDGSHRLNKEFAKKHYEENK